MKQQEIPLHVKEASKHLIDLIGGYVKEIGKKNQETIYMHVPPEGTENGFPTIYIYNQGNLSFVTGFEALEYINLYIKE